MSTSNARKRLSAVPVRATVGKVLNGVRGKYAIAYIRRPGANDETVTFSFLVWEGESDPEPGQVVELTRVELFEPGWRAHSARPISFNGSPQH